MVPVKFSPTLYMLWELKGDAVQVCAETVNVVL